MGEWQWIDSAVEYAQDGFVSGEWERCKAEIAALRARVLELESALRGFVGDLEAVGHGFRRRPDGAYPWNAGWTVANIDRARRLLGLEVDRG